MLIIRFLDSSDDSVDSNVIIEMPAVVELHQQRKPFKHQNTLVSGYERLFQDDLLTFCFAKLLGRTNCG